ncbi:GNAT family N-acetyltransferase [Chloroflexi bacterium CFX2]|nr:GNAT family N-acetyltransferase [Chloroflexi bacterium CFX2]
MILIRPYSTKDSVQLSQIVSQVCASVPWMATRRFIPTNSWFHAMEMIECHSHRLLVAESNGEIVGWCRSFPATCGVLPSHAELGIGLLEQYRGQGIGSEMIRRSLEWAESVGLCTVDLMVSPHNSLAIHVFEKCGFKTVKVLDEKMVMSIWLS